MYGVRTVWTGTCTLAVQKPHPNTRNQNKQALARFRFSRNLCSCSMLSALKYATRELLNSDHRTTVSRWHPIQGLHYDREELRPCRQVVGAVTGFLFLMHYLTEDVMTVHVLAALVSLNDLLGLLREIVMAIVHIEC